MNGGQDLGGAHGHGPVQPEPNEPAFHAEWERRVFALNLAMGAPGGWNIDMGRFARENRPPGEYLKMSYFEIWLAGLEQLLAERGLVSAEEVAAGRAIGPPKPVARILSAGEVAHTLARGGPSEREPGAAAQFAAGDTVRAKTMNPASHTRLPRYVRGHVGIVEAVRGRHVFPDPNALGHGENPQWLYLVRFEGRELWGSQSDPAVKVSVDAWEPYLEPG